LDSPQDDIVRGNGLNYLLSCSGGSDHLTGEGGRDTYMIEETCHSVTINNLDKHPMLHDFSLLRCSDSSITLRLDEADGLVISCALQGRSLNITTLV
jgi:hypothetical protein